MIITKKDKDLLDRCIRTVPDFPKKGILFYDITTLLLNPKSFKKAIDVMYNAARKLKFDKIAAVESRGFVFGSTLAYKFKKGFILVRKEGKLPSETISYSYGLEYGTSTVEIHKDAIKPGDKILVVDDLLATGGTAKAIQSIVESLGGKTIGYLFLIELEGLKGREKLAEQAHPISIISILKYS